MFQRKNGKGLLGRRGGGGGGGGGIFQDLSSKGLLGRCSGFPKLKAVLSILSHPLDIGYSLDL